MPSTQNTPIRSNGHAPMWAGIMAAAIGLLLAPSIPHAAPFGDSRMIIEVNATDGDAGIQVFIDGPGWSRLEIFDPFGIKITDVTATASVGQQGWTELFAESAEPSFEDQTLQELFARFPEGNYALSGVTVEGGKLTGKAQFKHNIPAGPNIISPAAGTKVSAGAPVVIDWDPVTRPFFGTSLPVNVVAYQVIVERPRTQPLQSFSITLPASVTQVTVPAEFLDGRTDYVFEVLAIEASGNQTISQSGFATP